MDAAGLTKLLSPEGWALLSALPPYDERRTIALSERLRRDGVDPDLVAAALTQSRLRAKAHPKLDTFADAMLFTPAGLEQATRLTVAAHHARRYVAAGVTTVADLTCGIGADSLAFAGVGLRVLAVDADELTAALATVNLRAFPEARVRHGDGLALDLRAEGVDGVYADPARRVTSGRRVFDPAAYEPPLDAVMALTAQVPAVGVKVGPGIPHTGAARRGRGAVGLGRRRRRRGRAVVRPAAHRRARGAARSCCAAGRRTSSSTTAWGTPSAGPVGAYLYEPDGAVIRAGLVAQVVADVDGRLLDRTIAYVTSDALHETPVATAYRVLDTLPFGLKRLRTYLRERGVGRLTIKKRGTAVVPEQLRKQLDLRGDAEATVVLTRVGGSQQVLVVDPVS